MKITLHPDCKCPECQHVLNAAAVAHEKDEGHTPHPGSLTLCSYCGSALTYFAHARALRVRRLTREEWQALTLTECTDLTRARRALTLRHVLLTDWRYQV